MEKDERPEEELEETPQEEEPEVEEEESTDDSEPQEGNSTDEVAELKKRHAIEMRKLRKELKKTEQNEEKDTAPESLSREEAKLYARGLEDDEVDRVIRIAKLDDISLTEAYESEEFKLFKEKKEREAKRREAQLGAGKGASSQGRNKKDFSTPGLSAEEHKKLWQSSQK